jgi:hypothetical protein
MFFNVSNHPSYTWGDTQKESAAEYGEVIDIQFPNVNPKATIDEISKLSKGVARQVHALASKDERHGAMVQGEYTTVYQILRHLESRIDTFAATSTRSSDGKFTFVGFRPYEAS